MDGYEFLGNLRRMPGGDQPKVVFCTTENDVAHIARALHAGANEYIMKPFDKDIVTAKFPGSRVCSNLPSPHGAALDCHTRSYPIASGQVMSAESTTWTSPQPNCIGSDWHPSSRIGVGAETGSGAFHLKLFRSISGGRP